MIANVWYAQNEVNGVFLPIRIIVIFCCCRNDESKRSADEVAIMRNPPKTINWSNGCQFNSAIEENEGLNHSFFKLVAKWMQWHEINSSNS